MSRKESINTSNYKVHDYPGSVMFIHIACLWMCVLFYFSFVCLHVCAYAFKFKVDFGSAFEPGTSGLPYCCTPPVCVPAEIGELPVWRHNQKKKKMNACVNLLKLPLSAIRASSATLFRHRHQTEASANGHGPHMDPKRYGI